MDNADEIAALRQQLAVAQNALRESETRNRLFSANWAQAIWETDAAGVVVADSPSWRAHTGQTLEEWLGYGWLGAVHPDDRAFAVQQWRQSVAAQRMIDVEYRLRTAEGGWRWTNVHAAPVLDEAGAILKWSGVNINIDARKRAEEALRESEQKYRNLFESIDEGFLLMELVHDEAGAPVDYRYLQCNPAYLRQSGLADPTGQMASVYDPVREPAWLATFEAIARTGEPVRFEQFHMSSNRWYSTYASRVGGPGSRLVCTVFSDITERKRAETILRESEERQAFLLRFSDTLRIEPDANAIAERAIELLSSHLGLDRCYITYYRPDEDIAEFPYQRGNATVPPLPATVRLSDFPDAYGQVLDRTFVLEDDFERRGLSAAERANSAQLGMRAMVASTIRKGEKAPLASMAAVSSTPRKWTTGEVTLVEEVAERTWSAMEHARAEAALRESEERFRQFAAASAAGLWIRDAETLSLEFVSPAIEAIYGISTDKLRGGIQRWAAMIVPEDRESALRHIERARHGETAQHEFRIQRADDGTFRWIRNTYFPLRDNGDIPRIGGIAEDFTEAKLSVEHQGVLLAELQHRVRNIMAMIRSMARRSADGAADVAEYRTLLEGRLLALARVQALLTRQANTGGSLRDIIESEVSAQAHGRGQFELVGPDVQLSPKAVEVLTLALHELSTNALKYGALSVPEGTLRVEWAPFEKRGRTWLSIDWVEQGTPPRGPVTRRGFGSDLIEGKIPYELGGTGRISIEPGGARCRLEFPLTEGESILETDAPAPTFVLGGTLDMTGATDLTGRSVLVVDDDYYIASDTAAALRGAGATVLGPCPSEDATLDLMETETPTHAVLDLNLGGGGPKFAIAHALKARGIPFIFLTGYDPDVIPPDLVDIVRLQKPVTLRTVVEAVTQLD